MLYPDSKSWDNHGAIDPENYNKKSGIVPYAFKQMIDRLTIDPNANPDDSNNEGNITGGDHEGSDANAELNGWLEEQEIPPHPDLECATQFRVHEVDNSNS